MTNKRLFYLIIVLVIINLILGSFLLFLKPSPPKTPENTKEPNSQPSISPIKWLGNKNLPTWPIPNTLRVVKMNPNDKYRLMTIAALQGLVNRQAPEATMVYLELDGFPDQLWRDYYAEKLNLEIVETSIQNLIKWVKDTTEIKYFIIIDPSFEAENINGLHTSTINIANTLAGIFGNAIPVHPDDVSSLESFGFSLLPDYYLTYLGDGGKKLRTSNAFDLRNQWQSKFTNAPWNSREDSYRWALDTLLPLVDHHAISLNYETPSKKGGLPDFAPWLNDYSVGAKIFSFYFNPKPDLDLPAEKTNYDYNFYKELLQKSGPFTMVRGWHWDELSNLKLISEMKGMHAGSKEMANSTVHMALSQLFTKPFQQRQVLPAEVNFDPNKIYLAFSVTDGDQFGVSYNFYRYDNGRKILWDDPTRSQIPINWTMNGLLYEYGRGIMNWYYENASSNDYFTADLPVGYAWFTDEYFGGFLDDYENLANTYLIKSGLTVADFLPGYGSFPLVSSKTVVSHVNNLTNAVAIREGYSGGFYQGIYWPEEKLLFPYIRNSHAAGGTGYENNNKKESGEDVALVIERMIDLIPWRPLFVHLTWINWFMTPTEMKKTLEKLNQDYPNKFELVSMPEFIALAQEAKLTSQYPLEFYPHTAGELGLEGPYLWEDHASSVRKRQAGISRIENFEDYLGRSTTGNNYVIYKFNIYPSNKALLTIDIEGSNYQVYASPDNQNWTSIISGSSSSKITKTADLTSYLNDKKSVYIKFTGEMNLSHLKIDY